MPPKAPKLASPHTPMNGDFLTSGPSMRSFPVEANKDALWPTPTNVELMPPGPHKGSFPGEKNQDTVPPSDTQKFNQIPMTVAHHTATSKCSNASAALTDKKSAASNMQGKSAAHGPTPNRIAYGGPSEPSFGIQKDPVSEAQAQPSVHTTALALSTSSTSRDEFSKWASTPYELTQVEGNKWCPRLAVSQTNGLCSILGVGRHPIAKAIARIHLYGHENHVVPSEVHQVMTMFDEIRCHHRGSHHITFLDPALYDSDSHSQAQLEVFRKQEWGWLARAGRPIGLPGILCGVWDFVTIEANYQRLEVALVLARGDHLITIVPGRDYAYPPQKLDPIQVRSILHLCSEVANLFPSCIKPLCTTPGPLYL